MTHSISDQIKAIQEARRILAASVANERELEEARILDAKLNDAGSSLAALNLNPPQPTPARDEYFNQLYALFNSYITTQNNSEEFELERRILSISYDRVVELENKLAAIEKAIHMANVAIAVIDSK